MNFYVILDYVFERFDFENRDRSKKLERRGLQPTVNLVTNLNPG